MLIAPTHTIEVGSAKSQFALAFNDKQSLRELFHQSLHNIGRAVGRIVLNDEHIELFWKRKDLADNGLNVFFLVVSRCNY